MNERTLYLSYHRSFSYSLALALFHRLRARGCDVFLDVERFDRRDPQAVAQIEARAHFLILLTPGMIEPMQHPDDPLGCEIDRAIRIRRSIIPLLTNGFSFDGGVPHILHLLRRYYALPIAPDTLDQDVDALCERIERAHFFGTLTPGDFEATQHKLERASRLAAPTPADLNAEAVFNRAHMRSRLDHAGKLADYDEALRLNPAHLYARFERALVRRRSGDELGAVADYDAVLRISPQFYRAYNNRAELHFARGEYRLALADYEQATALRPTYVMALAGKALTLHALGQVEAALRLWQPLVEQDERFIDAVWVGRDLNLPTAMIDEMQRLLQRLHEHPRDLDG